MFGFKKQSPADKANKVMRPAIAFAAEKWAVFNRDVPFKPEVGLDMRIFAFMQPVSIALMEKYEPLRKAPDSIFLLISAMAVERSGTHTRDQIESALGLTLPD